MVSQQPGLIQKIYNYVKNDLLKKLTYQYYFHQIVLSILFFAMLSVDVDDLHD